MDSWVGWSTLVGTLAIQVAGLAFFYGKLVQKVSSHDDRLDKVETKVEDHGKRIGQLEGWLFGVEK